MHKTSGIILRELIGIKGVPAEECSYEANLRECLKAKENASLDGDMASVGHAARGAAESYRRLGRLEEAGQEFKTAADFFTIAGNKRGLAWTLLAYSNLLRQSSRYIAATKTLSESMTMAQACGDLGLIAYVTAGMAETTRITGDYDLARRQHLVALRMFRSLEDARGIVWALEGIGQMLKNTGRLNEALQEFSEAKKLAAGAGDMRGLGYALKCRAECLSGLGHPSTAIEEALMAIRVFERIGLKVGLAYSYKSLGDILRAQRTYNAASINYRMAAQVFAELNDGRGLAYTFNGLGLLLGETDGSEDAGVCFAHAANFFKNTGVKWGWTQGTGNLLHLMRQQRLSKRQTRDIYEFGLHGQLPLPSILINSFDAIPPERRELVHAGWRLISQYRRSGVRYLRAEKSKVWDGVNRADCSSFVQHALIMAGYNFARSGRLTTTRLRRDPFWSQYFHEISQTESKPGDIILQGRQHMGIFTGFHAGQPKGFQMGEKSNASELVWGENGDTAPVGLDVRFFRLKSHRN